MRGLRELRQFLLCSEALECLSSREGVPLQIKETTKERKDEFSVKLLWADSVPYVSEWEESSPPRDLQLQRRNEIC